MATLENPLDAEDFDRIEQALKKTQEIERALNKAKAAGIDIGEKLAENRANREKLLRIQRAYKPGVNG